MTVVGERSRRDAAVRAYRRATIFVVKVVIAWLFGGALCLASCGSDEPEDTGRPTDLTTSSTTEVFYEDGDGLRCPFDLFADEIADFASDAPGFESIEAAADGYWGVQSGQTREERSGMVEEIRPDASILYSDSGGNGQLILRFDQYPNGWIQTGIERCATP